MNNQACLKSQFEVKDYHIEIEQNVAEVECFNQGYELEQEMAQLLNQVEAIQSYE